MYSQQGELALLGKSFDIKKSMGMFAPLYMAKWARR